MTRTVRETVKSNQWWISESELFPLVKDSPFVELDIEGRSCFLERSSKGNDGRQTYSFKFMRDDDRKYWQNLRGQQVQISLIRIVMTKPFVDEDIEDDFAVDLINGHRENACIEVYSPEPIAECDLTTSGGNQFDAYLFVDWSANNRPKTGKDSIWIAEAFWQDSKLIWPLADSGCFNAKTRAVAMHHLGETLAKHIAASRRVLICFDFAYGYPDCEEFRQMADSNIEFGKYLAVHMKDESDNRSNRFAVANKLNALINEPSGEGPFWGRPVSGENGFHVHLKPTKPRNWATRQSIREFRVVENRLRNSGRRPFSVWQLFGNGSVGSQVLLGLPRVIELRNMPQFAECSAIWPFETGWRRSFDEKIRILHAEFWPGAIDIDETCHPVRDAAQVKSFARWAATEDSNQALGRFFDPLSEEDHDRSLALREGWILGFIPDARE